MDGPLFKLKAKCDVPVSPPTNISASKIWCIFVIKSVLYFQFSNLIFIISFLTHIIFSYTSYSVDEYCSIIFLNLNSDIFNQMSRVNNQQEEENIFKGSSFLDQKVIKKQFEEIEKYYYFFRHFNCV